MRFVNEFIEHMGWNRCVLRSDVEPSLLALKRAVKTKLAGTNISTTLKESVPGDHAANGRAESAVRQAKDQVRVSYLDLCARLGAKLPYQHVLVSGCRAIRPHASPVSE